LLDVASERASGPTTRNGITRNSQQSLVRPPRRKEKALRSSKRQAFQTACFLLCLLAFGKRGVEFLTQQRNDFRSDLVGYSSNFRGQIVTDIFGVLDGGSRFSS